MEEIKFNETPYKEVLEVCKNLIKEDVPNEKIEKVKTILKSKEKFINFYRNYCSLEQDGDVFIAIENKCEYAKKRGFGVKIKKHKKFLIREFEELLKNKRSFK